MTNSNGEALVGNSPDLGPIVQIKVSRIRPWKDQPRRYFEEDALKNLGLSIKRRQRLPIKVKRISDDPDHDFELIDGERRLRAAKLVGLEHLLAWVRTVKDEDEQYVDSVVSNLCRADHTALEKAEALMKLHKMGMSRGVMAEECGYSVGWVDQHLSLMRLEPEVQALMDPERPKDMQLSFSLALRLVSLPPHLQRELAEEIIDKKIPVNEARFLIGARASQSKRTLKINRSPAKDYVIVTGFISRLLSESKLVVEMPNQTFVKMLGSRSSNEIEVASGNIRNSISNLERLIEKLRAAKSIVDEHPQ